MCVCVCVCVCVSVCLCLSEDCYILTDGIAVFTIKITTLTSGEDI